MSSPLPLPDPVHGSPILLVHGDFGDGFESWGSACALIRRRRRTVVIDRPGFGVICPRTLDSRSRMRPACCSTSPAQMGIPSFHLVGHSYGGLIALEMAIMRPDILRSLHLIEPPLLDLLLRSRWCGRWTGACGGSWNTTWN